MAGSLNATFFAFRKREKGGVLLGATLAYALIALVVFGVFAALNWQAFVDYFSWAMSLSSSTSVGADGVPAFTPPPASVMGLVPAYFLVMFGSYLLLAAYEAACLKWMIRGETGGLFGLSLGADTWRVYSTYWMWFLLFMAAYIVCIIAVMVSVGGAVVAAQGAAEPNMAMAAVPLLVGLVICFGLLFFGVRFAPAAATSVARRKFSFFDAWTVTKGRFWALLGSYVFLFLMYFVGLIVLGVGLSFAVGAGAMGQFGAMGDKPSPEAIMAMFSTPTVLVPVAAIYGLMIVGAFVFYVALFGVNARVAQAALEEGKITAVA